MGNNESSKRKGMGIGKGRGLEMRERERERGAELWSVTREKSPIFSQSLDKLFSRQRWPKVAKSNNKVAKLANMEQAPL